MSYAFRLLFNETMMGYPNGNINPDGSYEEEYALKDIHKDYLWLLILDLLIFIGLTATAYISSKKMEGTMVNPDDFRQKFIKGLIYANGIRAFSLVIIILLSNSSGNNPSSWFNYLVHVVPALVFVSAYMSLVTVLADIYYSYSNYNNHLAKPGLLLVVVCSYILLAILGLFTFASKSFKAFAYMSEFLIGLVYLVLGAMIIYYGEKIAESVMSKQNQTSDPSSDMSVKMRILSLTIGALFMIKSLCGFLTAFGFFDDFYPVSIGANVWDFITFLITEIAPTVVFIIVSKKKDGSDGADPRRSVDTEMNTYQPPRT